jgi:hypothetical protein
VPVPTNPDMASCNIDPPSDCLNAIPQTNDYRRGNQVRMISIQVSGYVVFQQHSTISVPPPVASVAIWLYMDMDASGQGVNTSHVYQNTTGQHQIVPFRNEDYLNKFTVLKKWVIDDSDARYDVYDVAGVDTFVTRQQEKYFETYHKLDIPVTYFGPNQSSPTLANVDDNALHMMAVGDFTLGRGAEIHYHARVRFIDESKDD